MLRRMYGSLTFCHTAISQFLMADISFNIACKELKIAQIAQLNQLFQLLHLVHIYGHGFYELSRMLMRKNVNNDVSKDSPIQDCAAHQSGDHEFPLLFHLLITNSSNHLQLFSLTCVTFKVFPKRSLIHHMRYSFAFVSKL